MIRKRLGQSGLGELPEVWPICCSSELNAIGRASPTFLLVPAHPSTCLCSLNAMSCDGLSRATWESSEVELSQPLLRLVLEIKKIPRGPEGVYGRMQAMTLFS